MLFAPALIEQWLTGQMNHRLSTVDILVPITVRNIRIPFYIGYRTGQLKLSALRRTGKNHHFFTGSNQLAGNHTADNACCSGNNYLTFHDSADFMY